jgi:hypothetical protein
VGPRGTARPHAKRMHPMNVVRSQGLCTIPGVQRRTAEVIARRSASI